MRHEQFASLRPELTLCCNDVRLREKKYENKNATASSESLTGDDEGALVKKRTVRGNVPRALGAVHRPERSRSCRRDILGSACGEDSTTVVV